MGTTLLLHAHVGCLVIANMLTLTGHVLYTWTKDAMRTFGMYNHISGLDKLDEPLMKLQGKDKLKWGVQGLYTPFAVMSGGLRFDRVQPNMDDSTHTFMVLSPRLIFRTAFVTHEQIQIQYQYYMYGDWYTKAYNTYYSLPYPYGQIGNLWKPLQPDKHTFTIAASMWW
jgi:hypothetical protein